MIDAYYKDVSVEKGKFSVLIIKDIIYDKFGVFGEVTLLNSAAPTDVLKAAADSDVLMINKIKINKTLVFWK